MLYTPIFILLLQLLGSVSLSSTSHRHLLQNGTASCPLDFNLLRRLVGSRWPTLDNATACQYGRQGLRLVESDYLRRTNSFLPPIESAEACWSTYQTFVDDLSPGFDIRRTCGFETAWISEGCMNITTRQQFESYVPRSVLDGVASSCNHSLSGSACAACTTSLSSLQASYLTGPTVGNLSDCRAYPFIYAAAFANQFGPTDTGTAVCLFSLKFSDSNHSSKRRTIVIVVLVVGIFAILAGITGYYWHKKHEKSARLRKIDRIETNLNSALESISGSTTLFRYTLDEIKEATKNFSRENIIGRGGYGNVYKGVLPDGSEVALKRFKNCSAAGDASFTHEVEVIASVRHVNLVALRGYCVAATPFEGHQRIIVCDLVKNGSLHDHLFGPYTQNKLSWPIRQIIALGTARGLAYLHYGVQPGIIHRDIKASNILLDEKFEAKVADFGLAKFAPEGATHVSTRMAGTMGYVAPECALYGKLTERSDVYSFGVVLLELLSGKKALIDYGESQPVLLADWAWKLVKEGKVLDVIEEGMTELGTPEIMEKYVFAAVLCSHPQLYARPTMDQVLKMLDADLPVPPIPERPIPLIADIEDIEKAMTSSGSGQLSTPTGYQTYMFDVHGPSTPVDVARKSDCR